MINIPMERSEGAVVVVYILNGTILCHSVGSYVTILGFEKIVGICLQMNFLSIIWTQGEHENELAFFWQPS